MSAHDPKPTVELVTGKIVGERRAWSKNEETEP
jgi:hypothetical protein